MLIAIIKKELYIQSRNWKIRAFSGLYILTLTIFAFGLVWYIATGDATYNPNYGRSVFFAFVIIFVLLTYFISPALTFNSISLEKENNAFEQIRLTWIKPYQIIMGKAGLAFIYILLLLFASLPVIILMLPLGGVTLSQFSRCYMIILPIAFTFSMIGLMFSSIFKSSRNSGFMTYAIVCLFVFGIELIPLILTQILKIKPKNPAFNILRMINPVRSVINDLNTRDQRQITIAVSVYALLSLIAIFIALGFVTKIKKA